MIFEDKGRPEDHNLAGLLELAGLLHEEVYALVNKQKSEDSIEYTMHLKKMRIRQKDATVFVLSEPSDVEKIHTQLTEEKFRGVLLSTITHEIKTPLTVIQGSLKNIMPFVLPEGEEQLQGAEVAVHTLEYFIYDVIVSGCTTCRTWARSRNISSSSSLMAWTSMPLWNS